MFETRVCESNQDFDKAIEITRSYSQWLGIDLWFQNFEEELQNFPTMYGPPKGLFLLGISDGGLAGGVGLRPLEDQICEMKRLFVFDQFKGKGIGKNLCKTLINHASAMGYKKMRLDTLKKMDSARGLYRNLGFKEIDDYCFNPEPDAIYMELELH